MHDKFFLNLNNVITGPFERQQLLKMLKKRQLQLGTPASCDKKHWIPLQKALNLIMLESDTLPAPPPENIPLASPEPVADPSPITYSEPVPSAHTTQVPVENYQQEPYIQAANTEKTAPDDDHSFMRVIADTLGSLGNGSGYLQKLFHKGSGAMIGAGMFALFLSILMTILAGVIFASRYDSRPVAFYLRNILFVLLSGGIFWLFNLMARLISTSGKREFSYEADFLSAMHGMMNTALLTLLAAGTLWLFKNDAAVLANWNVYAVKLFIYLILGFFLFNLALSLRVNFFDGSQMGAGWASFWSFIEISLTLILWSLLVKPIYI